MPSYCRGAALNSDFIAYAMKLQDFLEIWGNHELKSFKYVFMFKKQKQVYP